MGTNYIAPIWRMPRNVNKDKLSNYGIDTTGTSVGINCGSMADLFGTASVTYNTSYSIWVKPEFNYNDSTYQTFFGNFASGNNAVLLYYQIADDRWRFLVGDGAGFQYIESATITSNEELGKGEWQHHCVVFDTVNNNAYYYINNQQINSSTSITKKIATTGDFYIGKKWDLSTGTWTGELSQACIFDYALSADQRTYLYNLNNPMAITGAEPIAYWPLGDNSNPNATAGYPNISVGADSVFDFESGDVNFIKAFDIPVTTFTEASFSAWVNFEDVSGTYEYIMGMGSGPGNFMSIGKFQTSGPFYTYDGTGSKQCAISPVSNRWYHVVVTQTGTVRRFYIDGVEDANSPFTCPALAIPYDNLTIGAYNNQPPASTPASPLYRLDGRLSNVQVWDTALELSDVEDLYNNGQPLMTGSQPQETNLQAWYKLNQTANYDGGVSGIAFEVDQIGSPDVGGSGDHAYVNPSLSPLSFECQDLNSLGTGAPNYDLAYPVSNGVRWKSLKVYGRYNDLYLSANISLQNGSTSFGYAGARLMYKIDGGSLVVWQDINVNPTDPNSLIAFNPTKSSLSCESSIEIWIECGTSNYSTSRVRIDNVTIKEGGSTGTSIYNEDFSNQSGAGWNGTYTPANSETYVDPVWQIPDARSAYPQSFSFDGIDDKINLIKPSNWDDNQVHCVSLWVKNQDSNIGYIVNSRGGGSATPGFSFIVNGQATGYIFSNTVTSKIATGYQSNLKILNDGKWHHVLWTHQPITNILKVYIDGIYKYTHIGSTGTDSTSSIGPIIGNSGGAPWKGKISNIMAWEQIVLTDGNPAIGDPALEQVAEVYNNGVPLESSSVATSNLKLWAKLDDTETYLKPAPSQTQNLYEAWLVENQKYPASVENCLLFGQNTSTIYDNFNLINEPELTVSFWYLHDNSVNSFDRVLGSRDNVAYNFYVSVSRSGAPAVNGILRTNDGAGGFVNNSFSFGNISTPTVGWRLLTLTYNGSVIKAYVNNEEVDSLSATGTVYDLNPYIGGSRNYNQSIRDGNGSADGMRMSNVIYWNKALTPSELTTLYNNGTPLLTKDSIPQDSSMLLWNTLENKTETIGGGLYDKSGNSVSIQSITNPSNIIVDNVPVSAESGLSSGMTESNLVNNNVSVLNGESEGMNSTNLVQSNLTRTQPYSNYSINFDPGTSEYFPIPSVAGTNIQPDEAQLDGAGFSVSVWVNADDITTAFLGIWQNDGLGVANYAGLSLGINSNFPGAVNIGFSDNTGAGTSNRKNYITASGVVTAGEWYNIIACYNNPDVDPILYINGVEHTGGFPNTSGTMTTPLGYSAIGEGSIGVIRNAVSDFNGKISNVSIYDHRITAEEALIIYNNGIAQDLQNANLLGLIYWWPMDESNTYYDGSNIHCRERIVAKDLVGNNSGNVDDIVGNAPGSEASGTGTNLTIADLIGDMKDSKLNAYSINMADYADGVTNPANSGRSTDTP